MKIRTHDYAKRAYPLVESLVNDEIEGKYRTLALNFPTMILQSGLAQAIGFLKAKGKAEHQKLLAHIEEILYPNSQNPDLPEQVLNSDVVNYQRLTRNALDASSWLKRYTQALLKKEGEQQEEQENG